MLVHALFNPVFQETKLFIYWIPMTSQYPFHIVSLYLSHRLRVPNYLLDFIFIYPFSLLIFFSTNSLDNFLGNIKFLALCFLWGTHRRWYVSYNDLWSRRMLNLHKDVWALFDDFPIFLEDFYWFCLSWKVFHSRSGLTVPIWRRSLAFSCNWTRRLFWDMLNPKVSWNQREGSCFWYGSVWFYLKRFFNLFC